MTEQPDGKSAVVNVTPGRLEQYVPHPSIETEEGAVYVFVTVWEKELFKREISSSVKERVRALILSKCLVFIE